MSGIGSNPPGDGAGLPGDAGALPSGTSGTTEMVGASLVEAPAEAPAVGGQGQEPPGKLERGALVVAGIVTAVTGLALGIQRADGPIPTAIAVIGSTAAFVALALRWHREGTLRGPRGIIGAAVWLVFIVGFVFGNAWWEDYQAERVRDRAQGASPVLIAGGTLSIEGDAIAAGTDTTTIEVGAIRLEPFEVTNRRYRACIDARECRAPDDDGRIDLESQDEWPVTGVSAADAHKFCEWIGRRLMTELDWVLAARGAQDPPRPWPWGEAALSPTRANLNFTTEEELDPLAGALDPTTLQPGDDLSEILGGIDLEGLEDSPVVEGPPVPVEDRRGGQTPDEIAHLVGNVAEWTSTSPELCPIRYECTTTWTPETPDDVLLVVRGHGYTTQVIVDDDGTVIEGELADPGLGDPVLPELREPDIGFRCAADE